LCTLILKREKRKEKIQTIDHQRQSNHDISTRLAPYVKGHACASILTEYDQIWPPRGVSRVFLMALTLSTRWGA